MSFELYYYWTDLALWRSRSVLLVEKKGRIARQRRGTHSDFNPRVGSFLSKRKQWGVAKV